MKARLFLLIFAVVLLGTLFGCQSPAPTPAAIVEEVADTATPIPQPTAEPTETPTPEPTSTPVSTDTPEPTATPTVMPTPMPSLIVLAVDAVDEAPLAGSAAQLVNEELGIDVEQTADSAGQAVFDALQEGATYTVTVKLDGYLDDITTFAVGSGENELTVSLTAGLLAEVLVDGGALRAGPGTVYDNVGSVSEGQILQVVGRNEAGDWLVVLTGEGDEAWLASELVDEVDVMGMTAVAVPVTPTPAPTSVVAAPPPPPAPALPAGNLITNGSFESGAVGWEFPDWFRFYGAVDHPQFVHSGVQAAVKVASIGSVKYVQHVSGVTPGQTYQAGAWVKVWSSSGEDRTLSENPGDYAARLCLNPMNESDPDRETSVCTGFVRPLDTWQYLTIGAVAQTDIIAV
ncbi:MAG: SH3 domain-containing protein, partial [Chloroflexi bacterium]|nr:SH3 domain-containing protein [Chloroflexota bacterium]